VLQRIEAGRLVTDAEYRGGVCRGHSRPCAGQAIRALECRKAEQQTSGDRNVHDRRPERCPERGLKERRSRLPRNEGTASGESMGREPGGWDEVGVGAVGEDAPVGVRGGLVHKDSICRTAGYVIRMSGGVGGRGREASSYPK
jgi:hypothetical protein